MPSRKPTPPQKRPKGTRGPEMPNRLERSEPAARRLWESAHAGAVKEFGEGGRAHRAAYRALETAYESLDKRWLKRRARPDAEGKSPAEKKAARRPIPVARATGRKSKDARPVSRANRARKMKAVRPLM